MVRRGITLLELLVVLAIIGILVLLTLCAVQTARLASLRMDSMNHMRQINLAMQSYASTSEGNLPTIVDVMKVSYHDQPPFSAILPYLEENRKIFVSPADPSLNYVNPTQPWFYFGGDYSSYAYNAIVFSGTNRLPGSITDGTSNTIGFGEHYVRCAKYQWVEFIFSLRDSSGDGGSRRPSFADAYYGDVIPVTSGNPPRTVPSVAGKTFQTRPPLGDSDATIPQTPHTSGMLAGMMDGSVRSYAPSVSPEVFWAAVTPAGGEIPSE